MHSNAPSPSTSDATRLRRQIARMKGVGRDTTDLERRVLELEYGDVASLEHGEPMQHTPGAIADVDADEPTPLNLSAMEAVSAQTTAQREDRTLLLNGVMRDERDASIYSALRLLYGAAHAVVGVTMAYVSYRASTLLADGLINLLGGW
jgi:hypothetical protein